MHGGSCWTTAGKQKGEKMGVFFILTGIFCLRRGEVLGLVLESASIYSQTLWDNQCISEHRPFYLNKSITTWIRRNIDFRGSEECRTRFQALSVECGPCSDIHPRITSPLSRECMMALIRVFHHRREVAKVTEFHISHILILPVKDGAVGRRRHWSRT